MEPPDPGTWYSLNAACKWFAGPTGRTICRITLKAWCAKYHIVPAIRHGYLYLSGEQVAALIELTTPTGGKLPESVKPKRKTDAKRQKEIQAAIDKCRALGARVE